MYIYFLPENFCECPLFINVCLFVYLSIYIFYLYIIFTYCYLYNYTLYLYILSYSPISLSVFHCYFTAAYLSFSTWSTNRFIKISLTGHVFYTYKIQYLIYVINNIWTFPESNFRRNFGPSWMKMECVKEKFLACQGMTVFSICEVLYIFIACAVHFYNILLVFSCDTLHTNNWRPDCDNYSSDCDIICGVVVHIHLILFIFSYVLYILSYVLFIYLIIFESLNVACCVCPKDIVRFDHGKIL